MVRFLFIFYLHYKILCKETLLSYDININHARIFSYVYLPRCMCLPTTEKNNIFPYMLYVLNQNLKTCPQSSFLHITCIWWLHYCGFGCGLHYKDGTKTTYAWQLGWNNWRRGREWEWSDWRLIWQNSITWSKLPL